MHRLHGEKREEEGKAEGSQYLSFRRGRRGVGGREGGGRFIRRNSGRNLMQINAGRRGCTVAGGKKGKREDGCCRSFFVDTRRYAARCGERARGERERETERQGQGGEGWNVGV